MILKIAAQELRYMLKSPQTYVAFVIFFLLPFFAMISPNVQIGAGGNVNLNSPFAITQTLLTLNVFAIFVVPAYMANAILKDSDNHFDGIIFSTPIRKADYLFGRFLGSFAALTIALMSMPLGMLMGASWPNVDPERLSPTNLYHYVYVFGALVVPTQLVVSAIVFAMAVKTRSLMFTYLAAMGLLILYFVGQNVFQGPEYRDIRALLDPMLFSTTGEMTRYWTAIERNTQLVPYEGLLLTNRLIWFGVTAAISAFAYFSFSFRKPTKLAKLKISKKDTVELARAEKIDTSVRGTPAWSTSTIWAQFMARVRFEVSAIYKSLPFIIIVGFSLFLLISVLLQRSVGYNLDAYPVSRLMIQAIQGVLAIGMIVVIIFYSADVIWRERTNKFSQILDAVPAPNWVFVSSKLIAIMFVLASIVLLGILISIATQLLNGYGDLELGLYLHRSLAYNIVPYLMIASLAVAVQVLTNNRFVGMMIMVLYLISSGILFALGFEDQLYLFAETTAAPLSDMNGSGRFLSGGYWLLAYWGFFTVLMVAVTYLLWSRGTLQPLRFRLRNLRAFKKPALTAFAVVALIGFVGSGSYIYYNTHILNEYRSSDDLEKAAVEYEKRFRQYENLPMPRTTDVKIDVDIYPYKRRVEARSTQVLENKTDSALESVHLVFPQGTELVKLSLEGATQHSLDEDYNYYIFTLDTPMNPGDTRNLEYELFIQERGFKHARENVSLVQNGTFINNGDISPYIGFWPGGMMQDRNTRREYGLEPLPRTPKLEDASYYNSNYIRQDSDFINFETTVSTVEGQKAIAPGYLQKDWTENGRHYFSYKMDAPILNFYSYLSAEYDVVREDWNGLAIEVYHHKPHTYNVARMIQSVKDSITYFNKAFSPYQHRQVRILEFPAYRTFAQAFPNTIPYSEGIGFIAKIKGKNPIDLPYYVTAHEVAHQWWAHQVMSAYTQGGTMLVETLAQYGALLVMEEKYGKEQIRKFLKFELDNYLSGRAGDPEGELPLYRVENQQYIHYRKGAVIMYALKDYLGEDVVNRSLQRLIALRAFKSDPYAISTDLVNILKEEAPEQVSLIEDFLEKITLFDLKAEKATVEELADGRFKVNMTLNTKKFYADAEGRETDATFDIPVDVGIFTKSPADADFGPEHVLHMQKHDLGNGDVTLELIVDTRPTFVGIDPYNKLIDRNSNDNLKAVEAAGESE